MINVLNEIVNIDLKDEVKFELVDVTDIREEDEYGGNKYHLVGKLENLKINLDIDISTGDKVIPKELKYSYPSLFENKKILVYTYNVETILAEKIETILRRGQYNSRMKDYYDIHMFLTKFKDNIKIDDLKLSRILNRLVPPKIIYLLFFGLVNVTIIAIILIITLVIIKNNKEKTHL